jgi:hypothetical protein
MKRATQKSSSKISNKKTKTIFNPKSNIIFEDNASKNSKLKMIFDKNEPFYKHIFPVEAK